MKDYKCLDCENEFTIDTEEDTNLEYVVFCPFCGEESLIINDEKIDE